MSSPAAFKLIKPSLVLDAAGANVNLQCHMYGITTTPSFETSDDSTACAPGRKGYSDPTWEITARLRQSFGAANGDIEAGAWNLLRALELSTVTFELIADGRVAVSDSNPRMFGTLTVPPIPFIDSDLKAGSNPAITMACDTAEFAVTPAA